MKWGWAVVHAQALARDISAGAQDEDVYTARTEYDAKRHCVIVRVDTIGPSPVRWGLRIGDVANNIRACLDHLAWTLVQRGTRAGTLTRREERNVYFPYGGTKDEFEDALRKLPGLRRTDRAVLRRYQPYVRGKRNLPLHCLAPLPDLTNTDKHKAINPVWSVPETGHLEVGKTLDCEITRIPPVAHRVVLQEGAEIQRVYVRKTGPNPDVHVEAVLSVEPTLDGRIPLLEWTQVLTDHTALLLSEFASPPEEIRQLPISGWAVRRHNLPAPRSAPFTEKG